MKAAFKRFLSFDARNVVPEVYWALGILYLLLVVVTLFSIRNSQLDPRARSAWVFIAIFVPILGMAAYSIYCLSRADYSFLRSLGLFRRKKAIDAP